DHTFQPPVPELTARFGVPNACTTCHDDKSPEWAATTIDRWYGNGDRRRAIVSMSDTIYKAGSGDVKALPEVARLAPGGRHVSLIRASGADVAGQLLAKARRDTISTEVINALIAAASDPEPVVRATAVQSLGLVVDDRTSAVIASHLSDPARVVRVRAAEALLDRRSRQLGGARGAAAGPAPGGGAGSPQA